MKIKEANEIYNKNIDPNEYEYVNDDVREKVNKLLLETPYFIENVKIKETKWGTNVLYYVYHYAHTAEACATKVHYKEFYLKPNNPMFISEITKGLLFEFLEDQIKSIIKNEKEISK